MKGKRAIVLALSLICITTIQAQNTKKIANNEISISAASTYGFTYDRFSPSFQIQYFRLVNPIKIISTGFAYEGILDKVYRHTFLVPIEFWLDPSLTLVIAPGFTFNEMQTTSFTLHVESRYEFHLGNLRLGPKAKFAFNQYENYVSVGIYVGVPF